MKKITYFIFGIIFFIVGFICNVSAQTNPYDGTGQKTAALLLHYLELQDKGVKFNTEDELQADIKNTLTELGFTINDEDLSQVRNMVDNAKSNDFWNNFSSSNVSDDLKKIMETINSNVKNTNAESQESLKLFYDFVVDEEKKVMSDEYHLSDEERVSTLIGLSTIKHTMLTLADDISLTSNISKSGIKVIHAKYSPEMKKLLTIKLWKWLSGVIFAVGTAIALIATGGGLAPAVIAGGSLWGGLVGFTFGWMLTEANR